MQKSEKASSDQCTRIREDSDKQTVIVLDAEHGSDLPETPFADSNHIHLICRPVEPLGLASRVVLWVEDTTDFAIEEGLHKLVFHLHGTGKH